MFKDLLNDSISLIKPGGQRHDGVRAAVQPDLVMIADGALPVEEGDRIERLLPNGLVESYEVIDRGFQQGMGGIKAHYQVKVQKLPNTSEPKDEHVKHNNTSVFVVHGRNEHARQAMFTFLRSIGLHPLEWEMLIEATGEGSPYVGRILAVGFEKAHAAVVLLTGDDEARLLPALQRGSDPVHEREPTPQPRQNVLLEAGMALGMYEARTVIVEIGKLRPISDIEGRHVVRMDNSIERRRSLIGRLKAVGCAVNDSGLDWIKAGDFESDMPDATIVEEVRLDAQEFSEEAKDLVLLMLYNGSECFDTTSGPQPRHVESGETALYDPANREVAVNYLLSLEELKRRDCVRPSSVGKRGVRYHLEERGTDLAQELRKDGRKFNDKDFPRSRRGGTRI